MLRKKSSVQISIEGKKDKNLEVPTFLINNWKEVVVTIVCTLFLSLATIVFLAKKRTDNLTAHYETSIKMEKERMRSLKESKLESDQDIITAKKSFNKIDSTLDAINAKMRRRGLSPVATRNAGGPVEVDEENIELLGNYYIEALNKLDDKLSSLPIGSPHQGTITSRFGYRRNPFTNKGREMHSGIDFSGKRGDPIKATASGTVTFSGYQGDYGYVVMIRHANGYETRYAHLIKPLVRKGQKVDVGNTVGLLGSTGRSTGPHLHYEILKNNKKINPERYLTALR